MALQPLPQGSPTLRHRGNRRPHREIPDLYEHKAGEEIVGQIYEVRRKDDPETHGVLRPEFTPSLARIIYARRGQLRFPLRWFAMPQCWRYERPGRWGRRSLRGRMRGR